MRAAVILVSVLALAACTGGHHAARAPTPQQRADAACEMARRDFFNAQPTTVGAIHAIPGPVKPTIGAYSNVLSGLPATAFAAWCWRQPAPGTYVEYIVGPNGEVVDNLAESNDSAHPPRPGPMLPT
jgi:hypothetical protein